MAQKILSLQGQGRMYVDPALAIVIPAVSAASLEDVELTVANAAVGDVVVVSLVAAANETDLGVVAAFVSEAGKIKVRLINNDGSNAATGVTTTCSVALIRHS